MCCREDDVSSPLTLRERQVGNLLAQGKSYGQIARELVVSPHTVRNHVRNIRDKISTGTTLQTALRLRELGCGEKK